MRPVPQSRHPLAVLILIGVSAAGGCLAFRDDRLSKWQMSVATSALKERQPELFACDSIFGSNRQELWRLNNPVLQGMLKLVLVPTGYGDPSLPFRMMAGVVLLVFLCSMYALLYRQCRSWSIAAFVAVASCRVINTLGTARWGAGPLASVTPPTICLAVVPLVVLAYLRYEDDWRLALVFAATGLLGNLHLATGANLAVVLLLAYLGRRRFSLRAWTRAIPCGLLAAAVAIPHAWYYIGLRMWIRQAGGQAAPQPAQNFWQLAKANPDALKSIMGLLYPEILKDLLGWGLIVLVLAIPAAVVLFRVERYRVRDLAFWVWFLAAGFIVSLGFQGVCQGAGMLAGTAPPAIDFYEASSLVMVPLYVMFAQATTHLFRIAGTHKRLMVWACAAFLAAWMVPSDNLRLLRYGALEAATSFMDEPDKPAAMRRFHRKQQERNELVHIAAWAAEHSDASAVFVIDSIEFRLRARRAITTSSDDVGYFYYLAPDRLEGWLALATEQSTILQPPTTGRVDAKAMEGFIRRLAAQPEFRQAGQWYAILSAAAAPERSWGLEEVASGDWGRHYCLYHLPAAREE